MTDEEGLARLSGHCSRVEDQREIMVMMMMVMGEV